MQPNLAVNPSETVHQRYRELLRAGFTPNQAATLTALAAGIGRHAEGESAAATTWRWQEISRIEFLGYLASNGQLGGAEDGQGYDVARQRGGR